VVIDRAKKTDLDEVVAIDHEVIGSESRREYIAKAIADKRCLVAKAGNSIAGYLIYNTSFFGHSFISLLIVKSSERRKGYATALLNHFLANSPTEKVFSSTNLSNKPMQEVFKVNGWVPSGFIENLDDGDPELIYFKPASSQQS